MNKYEVYAIKSPDVQRPTENKIKIQCGCRSHTDDVTGKEKTTIFISGVLFEPGNLGRRQNFS